MTKAIMTKGSPRQYQILWWMRYLSLLRRQ